MELSHLHHTPHFSGWSLRQTKLRTTQGVPHLAMKRLNGQCLRLEQKQPHTHTHIYIYIYREKVQFFNNLKGSATRPGLRRSSSMAFKALIRVRDLKNGKHDGSSISGWTMLNPHQYGKIGYKWIELVDVPRFFIAMFDYWRIWGFVSWLCVSPINWIYYPFMPGIHNNIMPYQCNQVNSS